MCIEGLGTCRGAHSTLSPPLRGSCGATPATLIGWHFLSSTEREMCVRERDVRERERERERGEEER